jgi:hypothetical protein
MSLNDPTSCKICNVQVRVIFVVPRSQESAMASVLLPLCEEDLESDQDLAPSPSPAPNCPSDRSRSPNTGDTLLDMWADDYTNPEELNALWGPRHISDQSRYFAPAAPSPSEQMQTIDFAVWHAMRPDASELEETPFGRILEWYPLLGNPDSNEAQLRNYLLDLMPLLGDHGRVYIGATSNPRWRMLDAPYCHYPRYDRMMVLAKGGSMFIRDLEKRSIDFVMRQGGDRGVRVMNVGSGGERIPKRSKRAYYLYAVYAT